MTVFKNQIKIFERKFLSDRDYDSRVFNAAELVKNASDVFLKKDPPTTQPPPSDPSKVTMSIVAAAQMKKNLENTINRIDLLTDSKIGEIKTLMRDLA